MINLAISNIAWNNFEDNEVYKLMNDNNFTGLEISPAKIEENLTEITDKKIINLKLHLNKFGIKIVAMQALLYGHPELKIFEDEKTRENTLEHLKKCIDLGALLGAKALVFGSPKNRNVPEKAKKDHMEIAMDFFDRIGTYASRKKILFCIEPNPEEYGTNFICTTQEAISFVRALDNEGIRINLDTGSIIMNNEDHNKILEYALQYTGHIHVSEPFLNPIDPVREIHIEISNLLKAVNYSGNVSIEMKKVSEINNVENIRNVLVYVKKLYS